MPRHNPPSHEQHAMPSKNQWSSGATVVLIVHMVLCAVFFFVLLHLLRETETKRENKNYVRYYKVDDYLQCSLKEMWRMHEFAVEEMLRIDDLKFNLKKKTDLQKTESITIVYLVISFVLAIVAKISAKAYYGIFGAALAVYALGSFITAYGSLDKRGFPFQVVMATYISMIFFLVEMLVLISTNNDVAPISRSVNKSGKRKNAQPKSQPSTSAEALPEATTSAEPLQPQPQPISKPTTSNEAQNLV